MQSTAQTVGQRQIHDPSSSGAKETLAAQVPHVAGAPVWGAHSCQPPLILILIFIFVILNLAEKSVRACPERSQRESASDFGWRSAFSAAINEWEEHDFSRAVKRPWMEGFSPYRCHNDAPPWRSGASAPRPANHQNGFSPNIWQQPVAVESRYS